MRGRTAKEGSVRGGKCSTADGRAAADAAVGCEAKGGEQSAPGRREGAALAEVPSAQRRLGRAPAAAEGVLERRGAAERDDQARGPRGLRRGLLLLLLLWLLGCLPEEVSLGRGCPWDVSEQVGAHVEELVVRFDALRLGDDLRCAQRWAQSAQAANFV